MDVTQVQYLLDEIHFPGTEEPRDADDECAVVSELEQASLTICLADAVDGKGTGLIVLGIRTFLISLEDEVGAVMDEWNGSAGSEEASRGGAVAFIEKAKSSSSSAWSTWV